MWADHHLRHWNICAHLSTSVWVWESLNGTGNLPSGLVQPVRQPAGGALRFNPPERAPREGDGGCVLRWKNRASGVDRALFLIHPPPLGDGRFAPELCLRFCSSLLKRSLPSPFSILVSICLFISLPSQPPRAPPPFFFLLPANRSIAKNSSVGLLRIYICKWEPVLLVNLQLSKQLKLTNNVGPHYFTNNRVSHVLIHTANHITFFLLPLYNWLEIMSWTTLKVFD